MTKILQSIPYPTFTTAERDLLVDVLKNTKINNSDTGKVEEYNGSIWIGDSSSSFTGGTSDQIINDSVLVSGVTVTDALNNLQTQIQSSGQSIISDTYANIKALVDSNSLIPESTYIITDFQTKYTQLETLLVKTGPIEPLTLIAATTNTFYEEVKSGLFPKDEILYNINGTTNYYSEPTPLVADKGVIIWRKDDKYNDTGYDHRVILWRRNSTDVLTFGIGCYNNTVGVKRVVQADISSRDNVFGNGCFDNVFGSSTWANTIGFSANYNIITGEFNNNVIGGNFKNNIIGSSFNWNTIGFGFRENHILNSCYLNNFGSNFQNNDIKNNIQKIDWTLVTPTHVIKPYNCTIFQGVANDGITLTPVLSYFNTTLGDIQYVNPTS